MWHGAGEDLGLTGTERLGVELVTLSAHVMRIIVLTTAQRDPIRARMFPSGRHRQPHARTAKSSGEQKNTGVWS